MSSVPLRARSPFFSFDAETGSRRPRWATLVAGILVLLLAAAGLVAGVSAANAHTPKISADCYSLKVDLTQYNTHGGTNHVYVKINDVVKVDTDFSNSFNQTFTFDDPSVVNTWSVVVNAHDDPHFNKGWSVKKENQKTTPCAAPELTLTATTCNVVNGSTTLTATFSKLVQGQTYTGRLFKNGQQIDQFVATSATKTWPAQEAGATYRLTVTSDQHPGLTKSVETHIVGCPQNSQLQVTANQCTVTGASNASVTVTATSLVVGRSYVARVHKDGVPYGGFEVSFTAGAGETSKTFTINNLTESVTGLYVVLTDVASDTAVESAKFSTDPCPKVPTLAVAPSVCTVVGADLVITVDLANLVPGRSYDVAIDGTVVGSFPNVSSSNIDDVEYKVAAGTHTVTVIDVAAPAVTASSGPITVVACPTQPSIGITPVQCTVPGGSGSLTASFTGLSVGRSYEVTITEDGNAMAAYPAATIDSTTTSAQFTNLKPGSVYVVTVTDLGATNVRGAASQTLSPCPDTPTITVTPQCELISNTTYYGVNLDKLEGGQQYVVTIKDDKGVDVLPPVTVTGGAGGLAPTFQVPNGAYYTLAVTHATNAAITASIDVFAAACDLPTFPLPPELPTLALTGAGDTTMPMLGALGLVQFGVALLALAAMLQFAPRRRVA